RYPSNSGKLLVIEAAQHPPQPGSGVGLPTPVGYGATPHRFPCQISVFRYPQYDENICFSLFF
ncbi:MAG: hypothetical protein IJ664_02625, partial [Clostridia bacterium]|nr:hypothetical protein [Clostridia bacterium]